ncbi:alkaline phosphatase D family protein [Streptomyces sp. DSM 44915]|uniref:Alkaline phosphatase D family protein n=1 Tax=Streptomyces chisholmiae TaxID=3075540 RepID=A0ABU2JIF7_9ACTN|nr:alkaline phosphatase D family protein [Streptomyces sp. DSM 44915]MDT0264762.1 alkaline phosphatase D family protein [Streptomyces sp. DSM 44915]
MTQIPSPTEELRAAARRLDRRRFLTVTGAAAALAFAVNLPNTASAAAPADGAALPTDPFTLGVASGDPLPDSVVLWTRLAPEPLAPDGGLPAEAVEVAWEIAADPAFDRIVAAGTATAHPEFQHSVRVEPAGLAPATTYYYRFRAGRWRSETGRTRTAPAPDARPAAVRFGLVSCQRYDQGFYTAYRHLAAEPDLDAVLHLGDYLYEYPVNATAGVRNTPVPAHLNRETHTLEDYRLRYALYHSDPDLRAAHAAHPFIVTWDDHEVDNNYAGAVSEQDVPAEEFLVRRAAAYRAYWENMPLRAPQLPDGPDLRLYRRLRYGRLAQLDILDTRQYRDDQAHGDGWQVPGEAAADPARTLLGAAQERWLADGWRDSTARWNLLPQQVTFARRRNRVEGPWPLSMDAWDGYPAARERLLTAAERAGVDNLVVCTGDVHVHYAFDLKADWDDPDSRTLGVELVTSSISSGGDGAERPANWAALTEANPHLRFYDGRRGYVVLTLDAEQLRADFRTVDAVSTPDAGVGTAASFVSRAGDPGLRAV